jgi:hypothetical protein
MRLCSVLGLCDFESRQVIELKTRVICLVTDLYHFKKAGRNTDQILKDLLSLKTELGASGDDMPWPD